MDEATGSRPRFRELDVFRGIAAVWVLLFHLGPRYEARGFALAPDPPFLARTVAWLDTALPDVGVLPVFWFFMISGFVITWTLERCETLAGFARSRIARLYPVYWAATLLTVAVGAACPLPGQSLSAAQVFWNLTMIQELVGVPHVSGVYWSLTVELLFYVGAAALFALGWLARVHWVCLAWIVADLLALLLPTVGLQMPWRVQQYAVLDEAHFLIAGIMFYQLWRGRRPLASAGMLVLCLLAVILTYPAREAAICAGFFAAFLLAIRGWLRGIVVPPLLWLGSISYALYVSHEMIGWRLLRALEARGVSRVGAIVVGIAATLALADGLTRLVERPVRRAMHARSSYQWRWTP